MPYLSVQNIVKAFRDFTLSLSFDVEKGEMISIIGPSGSGKSTLLSVIAGIARQDSGSVILEGNDISDLEIQKREIGMVFQDYALFQNMNVEKNIQYGMKDKDRKNRKKLTENLLALVDLEGYGKRSVSSLSGGEAQRVALARSLAAEPRILLLDEPLSALDAPLRKRLRSVIRQIHDTLGITMLYVTHDREEAFAISDRVIIMNKGGIEDSGEPETLYRKPRNMFSAFFTGEGTSLPCHLIYENRSGSLFFRPENATVTEEGVDPSLYPSHIILNGVTIVSAEYLGDSYLLGLDYQGYPMLARTMLRPKKRNIAIMILKESLSFF